MHAGADGASEPEFEAIVTKYHGEIHRYVCRMVMRASDAEDLSQETFLRAYRAWPRLPPEANHRAWLYTIATNLCRNRARSGVRRRAAHATLRVTRREVDADGPEAAAVAGEAWTLAEAAIRRLPLKQRGAFILRKLHELDYETIGASLECSAESARAHVFQALRKLRATLDAPALRAGRSTR
jgi:RNA polymerase sigma-70 factor (ECF subfamily)